MIDSLANSIAGEFFSTEGSTHPSMGMPHAQMVAHAYGYHKREWVGLTQDEQDKVFKTFSKSDAYKRDFLNRIASAIEAKLKEKNT